MTSPARLLFSMIRREFSPLPPNPAAGRRAERSGLSVDRHRVEIGWLTSLSDRGGKLPHCCNAMRIHQRRLHLAVSLLALSRLRLRPVCAPSNRRQKRRLRFRLLRRSLPRSARVRGRDPGRSHGAVVHSISRAEFNHGRARNLGARIARATFWSSPVRTPTPRTRTG